MAKFIIEVSDDYIKKLSQIEDCEKEYEGKSAVLIIAAYMGCSYIYKRLNEGKSEFNLSENELEGDAKDLFYQTIHNICLLLIKKNINSK